MAVTTSARSWNDCNTVEQMQRRHLKMGVSAVFTLGFFVFLTCAFVSWVILLSVFSPNIHFALQDLHWQALLRLFVPRRALVNISRITCGIPFWNCSFSSTQAAYFVLHIEEIDLAKIALSCHFSLIYSAISLVIQCTCMLCCPQSFDCIFNSCSQFCLVQFPCIDTDNSCFRGDMCSDHFSDPERLCFVSSSRPLCSSGKAMESPTSSVSTESSSGGNFAHNVWNPLLELMFHERISGVIVLFVEEIDLAKIAISCPFALDLL